MYVEVSPTAVKPGCGAFPERDVAARSLIASAVDAARMSSRLVLLLAILPSLAAAGCAEDAGSPGGAAAAVSPAEAPPAAAPPATLPIVLDGSTATQAMLCVVPAPPCRQHEVVGGTSDLFFENLVGRIANGSLSMTWTATNPATEELAFGIMVMGGEGDGCAPVSLGILRGRSPLALDVAPMARDFCEGDSLHVWASNGIYVGEDPAYVQLDVDQAFHIEGSVTIAAATIT